MEDEEINAIILSINFEKCFDRIEISALLSALNYFGFGPDFVRRTQIIYTNPKACVTNNGHLSSYMNVWRGVKQGGPCSAYYFLVIAEILAIEIRDNSKIKGVWVEELHKKLGQFADDTDMHLIRSEQNLKATFQTIEIFSRITGFKINYNKTTVYRIGSSKKSSAVFYMEKNLNWESKSINVLGVDIAESDSSMLNLNYVKLVEKIPQILLPWRR